MQQVPTGTNLKCIHDENNVNMQGPAGKIASTVPDIMVLMVNLILKISTVLSVAKKTK